MAIQRLSLSNITTAILEITGYKSSTLAPWSSDANLYTRINTYGQRLPMRLNTIAREMQIPTPVRFDMWRSSCGSSTSSTTAIQVLAASSTVYLPVDYDHWISFYDSDNSRPIEVLANADKYDLDELVLAPSGIPRYIEILGYVTEGSNWRRKAVLYPATQPGVEPAIEMAYWRLPAIMAGASPSSEYPDVDPKYSSVFIYGPVVDLVRATGQEFDRYSALEKELLIEMISSARSV